VYYDRAGNPITLDEWAAMATRKARRVALTEVGPYVVSTVWLGLDHGFGPGHAPLIFETMVFPGQGWHDDTYLAPAFDYQDRYSTEDQARQGHAETVTLVMATLSEDWPLDAEPRELVEGEW
jgi:hypothetical protein